MTGNTLLDDRGRDRARGGGLVALGLLTSAAAFICSGEMAVAYFKAHAAASFWPVVNKGELAVLFCFVFLYIAAHGPGRSAWVRPAGG